MNKKKSGKGFAVVTVITSIAAILICTLVATLGVLDIAEVWPMNSTTYHHYTYTFYNGYDQIIGKYTLIKGEEFIEVIPDQPRDDDYEDSEIKENKIDDENVEYYFIRTHSKYIFNGWDINGDYLPDIIPKKAYFNVDAFPSYRVTTWSEVIYV